MKNLLLLVVVILTYLPAFGQIEQMRRSRVRMEQSIKADEEREAARRREEEASAIPKPKPAVMNVDVQAVLTRAEYKNFAEAKLQPATKIIDGEPLWLYVKFKGKLGDYVLTVPNAEEEGKLRYLLFAEFGPLGDVTSLHQYVLQFSKEELPLQELKINLAPGLHGNNKSIPVFLLTAGNGKPGLWNNEFRLTNSIALPRSPNDNLSKSAIVFDFAGGLAKYRKMEGEYDSIVLRGTTDVAKMPIPGVFFSEPVKSEVVARLKTAAITPAKFYFSGDNWAEFAPSAMNPVRYRKIFAAFTYQKTKDCFYNVAEIVQTYDFTTEKFGNTKITLENPVPIQCAEVR